MFDIVGHSPSCELKALRPDGSVFHTTRQVQISEKHCPRPATPPPPTPPPPTPPPQPPAPVKRCPAAPGLVCMEKANYPGDPGRYRRRVDGVRSRGQCRNICNRDPHCCHWVHYGPDRGNHSHQTSDTSHQHFLSHESRTQTKHLLAQEGKVDLRSEKSPSNGQWTNLRRVLELQLMLTSV